MPSYNIFYIHHMLFRFAKLPKHYLYWHLKYLSPHSVQFAHQLNAHRSKKRQRYSAFLNNYLF